MNFSINVGAFLSYLYVALLLGATVPVLMLFWSYNKTTDEKCVPTFEQWICDHQNRALVRGCIIIALPFLIIIGSIRTAFGFSVYGASLVFERLRKRKLAHKNNKDRE